MENCGNYDMDLRPEHPLTNIVIFLGFLLQKCMLSMFFPFPIPMSRGFPRGFTRGFPWGIKRMSYGFLGILGNKCSQNSGPQLPIMGNNGGQWRIMEKWKTMEDNGKQ